MLMSTYNTEFLLPIRSVINFILEHTTISFDRKESKLFSPLKSIYIYILFPW